MSHTVESAVAQCKQRAKWKTEFWRFSRENGIDNVQKAWTDLWRHRVWSLQQHFNHLERQSFASKWQNISGRFDDFLPTFPWHRDFHWIFGTSLAWKSKIWKVTTFYSIPLFLGFAIFLPSNTHFIVSTVFQKPRKKNPSIWNGLKPKISMCRPNSIFVKSSG